MVNNLHPESQDSSLYFHSTQIQARHEDQEHQDTKLSQLQRFKNIVTAPKFKAPKPKQVTKPKRSKKKQTRQINSISAFVRETLGGKKAPDTQSLLDQFCGDQRKLDEFLIQVELATKMPHLLSKKPHGQESRLFSEFEWKSFVESLRLRFPDLSNGNKKTLHVISRRLHELKKMENGYIDSQDLNSMWSLASRQPSNELSKEELIWLYDLDDEDLHSDSSIHHKQKNDKDGPDSPLCLTLSQAMDDRNLPEEQGMDSVMGNEDSFKVYSGQRHFTDNELDFSSTESKKSSIEVQSSPFPSGDLIADSETEIEPLLESEFSQFLIKSGSTRDSIHSALLFGQKDRFRQPWNPEQPFSVTTSLVFASTLNKYSPQRKPQTSIMLLPMKSPIDVANRTIMDSLTPTKTQAQNTVNNLNTPSCLRVDSSPIAARQYIDSSPLSDKTRGSRYKTLTQGTNDDVFLSANALFGHGTQALYYDASDSESLQFSPLKKKPMKVHSERVEVAGKLDLDPKRSTRVQLTVIPLERHLSDDVIPDSEEDPEDEISIIEITKEEEKDGFQDGNTSVLQVPSSPEIDQIQRLWKSPI